jgi:Tol biopolymer transport system component
VAWRRSTDALPDKYEHAHEEAHPMRVLATTVVMALLLSPAHHGLAQQSPAGPPTMAPPETRLAAPPTVVGPGVISTPATEFKATLSPDRKTLLYVVTDHTFRHMTVVQAERRDTGWATPVVASFSGIWRDGDPAFAPDGKSLLFISNRPLPNDPAGVPRRDYNIWSVPRKPDGTWGSPAALALNINTDSAEFAPSLTAGGTLYFSRGPTMYRATRDGTGFAAPAPLPLPGGDPAISADERFLLFDADGTTAGDPGDLFVSCRTATGWTPASRLADPVNSSDEEGDPDISADGRTLYFFSRRLVRSPDRAPRPRPATYAEVEKEALDNIYNGSRNLWQVELAGLSCGQQ